MLEKFLTEYYCVWVIFLLALDIWLIDLEYLICIKQLWSVINARISVYYKPYAGAMRSDEKD